MSEKISGGSDVSDLPPFISPLTHDEHAALGRIAVLWGQVDMMLDALINHVVGISSSQRQTLLGEKPIGAKLEIIKNHLRHFPCEPHQKKAIEEFAAHAGSTKTTRNLCFHGVWGFRVNRKVGHVVPAAQHFRAGDNPFRADQLPDLEAKLCRTSRLGMAALNSLGKLTEQGATRLFHGLPGDPPSWLTEWREQNPISEGDLDPRWRTGQLPFLANDNQ